MQAQQLAATTGRGFLFIVTFLILLIGVELVYSEEEEQTLHISATEQDRPPFLTVRKQTDEVCQQKSATREETKDDEEDTRTAVDHSSKLWGTRTNYAPSCQYLNDLGYLSAEYWIKLSKYSLLEKHFCNQNQFCDGLAGGWTRIAYINMTRTDSKCPSTWEEILLPRRSCGRKQEKHGINGAGCSAAIFEVPPGLMYDHVCGHVAGYQYCNTMAFWSYFHKQSSTINEPFLDGVTVSRFSKSYNREREHIWSFAAALQPRYNGVDAICSCTNANASNSKVPPWVGEHYFCETGVVGNQTPPTSARECAVNRAFYTENKLWDGTGCNHNSTCCEYNSPPWFCRKLQEKTNTPLEVRICGNGYVTFVNTPIETMELYVQ